MNSKLTTVKFGITSLCIPVLYGLGIASLVYSHTWEFKTSESSLTWRQPTSVVNQPLMSENHHAVAFANIEKALGSVRFNDKGEPALTAHTAAQIERAIDLIPSDSSDADLGRIRFLISKIHPQYPNNSLAQLTFNYRSYLLAQEALAKNEARLKTLDEAENALQERIELKQQYLGPDVTTQLFSKRHELGFYLIKRRKVLADRSLTPEQKESHLLSLKEALNNKKRLSVSR